MSTTDLAVRQQRGNRLQALRKACGLSAEAVAQAMTEAGEVVSRGAISNWERGENGIVIAKLPTLARILQTTEQYILTGESPTPTASLPSIVMPTSQSTPRRNIQKSNKLQNVCYDIRGPLLKAANAMEEQGHRIVQCHQWRQTKIHGGSHRQMGRAYADAARGFRI